MLAPTDVPPLFHLLPDAQFQAMVASGKTWGDVQAAYRQPDWCVYPDALDGRFGCWALVERRVTGEEFCVECPCHG